MYKILVEVFNLPAFFLIQAIFRIPNTDTFSSMIIFQTILAFEVLFFFQPPILQIKIWHGDVVTSYYTYSHNFKLK